MAMTTAPTQITVACLQVIVMPNGEVICAGRSLGWITGTQGLGRFLTPAPPLPTTQGEEEARS